jgi:Skp family chaperone for outer membrane proteins
VKRVFVYLSALVGLGGAVYLAGQGRAQQPGGAPPAPPPAAPQARPTIAVFNMAAVMRDYHKAKYHVYMLNKTRLEKSAGLATLREQYLAKQKEQVEAKDPQRKDAIGRDMVVLARQVEDMDRALNKELNDQATAIIAMLYDDIKMVVDKTAEMNGYHIVFAYPDAVTAEEMKNPMLKELKLKPPAAQPFFVSGQVNVTGVVVETLNKWYPPVGPDGKPVDMTKIPADLTPPQPPGAAGAGGPPAAPGQPMR